MTQISDIESEAINLADLLGEPPLLKGESENRYKMLRAAVERMLGPKTIRDHADVKDITDKIWEGDRYKRYGAKLLENTRIDALAVILTPFCNYYTENATGYARDYFDGNPEQRKKAERVLAQRGITEEMIYAQALAITGSRLLLNDRLIANRETSRRTLFKDQERLARKADKLARANGQHSDAAPGRREQVTSH
jgi:hypothetical protein